jgi:Tfp pilus assembly protein PilF
VELAPRLRREAIRETLLALQEARRPGLTALVADGGDRAARQALAGEIVVALDATLFDAVADPTLDGAEAPATTGQTLVILDGDVAPRLQESVAIRRGGHGLTVIIIPGNAVRAIGEPLAADLVLGVPGGHLEPAGEAPLATATTLPAALGLAASERPLPRVPDGEDLYATLWTFVTQSTSQGDDGARAIIRACQRLGAGRHQPVVRRVLASRWPRILDHLPATTPHAALAWARLFRDAGLSEPAEQVLLAARRAFPDDQRLAHAHLTLRMQGVTPSASDLARLDALLVATRRDASLRHAASYFAHTLARAQRRAGELAAARTTIEFALRDDPDNEVLLVEAGLIAANQGDWSAVETWFRSAHLLAPRSGVVLNAWGRAAAMAGEPDRAARLLARAHTLEPWNARHALELAHLAKTRGLLHQAEETLIGLLNDPEPATMRRVRVELADVLIEAGAERWDDAEAVCDDLETLEDAPGPDDIARQIGLRIKLRIARGEYRAAEALARDEGRAVRAHLLAEEITAILAQRDPHRVSQVLQKLATLQGLPAWRADPATRRVWAALSARTLLLRGEVAQARQMLDDELDRSPPLPVLLNARARLELDAAHQDAAGLIAPAARRAGTLLQISLAADPRNAYTHRELARSLVDGDPAKGRHYRYVAEAGLALTAGESSNLPL